MSTQRLRLSMPRELVSPNVWNGSHWRVKHRISQEWEEAIGAAMLDLFAAKHGGLGFMTALAAFQGPRQALGHVLWPGRKVRLTVTRYVPSARNFIRDDDNLRFSVKPILDALKRAGYITNDSRKWLEHETPTQHADKGGYRTVIDLEPL